MSPVSLPKTTASPSKPENTFQVWRSQTSPHFHQLSLEDAQGCLAHWVIPLPLKHIAKQPMLLWQLPASSPASLFTCLDAGPMQLAPAHPGFRPDLRSDLVEGVLRLCFDGSLLRGYFRLQCLPQGNGQLWKLTPIGNV